MRVSILGSGGGAPSRARETSCVLVRDGKSALLLDVGTGARRLIADTSLLEGVGELHVVLTHFHFDHVCGLPYLPWFCERRDDLGGTEILEPLRRPPVAPNDVTVPFPIKELNPGAQTIGGSKCERARSPDTGHQALDCASTSPAQIPTLSLSGYSAMPNSLFVESNATRAGLSSLFRTWCAPSGPAGKQATSPGSS